MSSGHGSPRVGVGGFYKLTFWLDKKYNSVAIVQLERSNWPTAMLWLVNTESCLLIAHHYLEEAQWKECLINGTMSASQSVMEQEIERIGRSMRNDFLIISGSSTWMESWTSM